MLKGVRPGGVVHTIRVIQAHLFAASSAGPPGFTYDPQFLSIAEEAQLLEVIRTLPSRKRSTRNGARGGAS